MAVRPQLCITLMHLCCFIPFLSEKCKIMLHIEYWQPPTMLLNVLSLSLSFTHTHTHSYSHTHTQWYPSSISCCQLDGVRVLRCGLERKSKGRERWNAISTPSASALFTLHVILQECHYLSEKWLCVCVCMCTSWWMASWVCACRCLSTCLPVWEAETWKDIIEH